MTLSWSVIEANAVAFSERWKDAHSEEAQGQAFTLDFFKVFGVDDPERAGAFERKVAMDEGRIGYIDFLWKKRIALEMKSLGKDLGKAYAQLKEYVFHLPDDEIPDLLMVCDFATIVLHSRATGKKISFRTKELRKHIRRFADIAGYETTRVYESQIEVNVKAAEKMAKLHDALKGHGYEGHNLEVYLVRLLFCMFADDSGIFPPDSFLNYAENAKESGSDLSDRIGRLFEVLNMPDETRSRRSLLSADLRQFRYINGGLFKDLLPTADFDAAMRRILIDCCKFDWSRISPAIFGAMFQGVMDKDKRREFGAHYTSEENILKLINPLFMDDLWREFEQVKIDAVRLNRFHEKISRLKFLDPACGCGNFLLIAYRELRLLELAILKMKVASGQKFLDLSPLLKVSVEQFYGIELEGFPCQIAEVGMWLMDHLMNLRVADSFGMYFARLPLSESAHIVNGNALRIDWEEVVPKHELSYILGNPPFVGYSNQSDEQKADVLSVYVDGNGRPFKNAGKIDYVAAWYYKAAEYMQDMQIRAAFVSTNSITQGEQVAAVWKPLFEMFGVRIDFCYRTFKWSNEAKGKAAVHCVIVGFSQGEAGGGEAVGVLSDFDRAANGSPTARDRIIYDTDGTRIPARNINPYLVDAPTILIENRTKPLCDAPEMIAGGKPTDGGHLILSEEERDSLVRAEPNSQKYIRRYYMGDDFINNIKRYCLWLVGCPPNELRNMPSVIERVERVRQMRLGSKKPATRAKAETPMLFDEIRKIEGDSYVAIPKVSSERRKYIPIGFLAVDNIPGDMLFVVSKMGLYGFGILTSNVHMSWTHTICGRLKSDYRYSNTIVYNNFPWPDASDEQKANIEKLAKAILDARALFPESSLADLYDPLTMPPNLLKAHNNLDRAVMKLYGFAKDMTEAEIVAALMERCKKLVER
ncbi:MAG: class I SAM-dependent DNA methyltransferase [Betaproteobacteria bacterium]|nr:class I SAM-dependent DNA methyltransferase [Betaproteobacteria bacterium]